MTIGHAQPLETKPLVSVVVPCFNQAHYAYESGLSARTAYSGPLEIIFVNDGSTAPGTEKRLNDTAAFLTELRCTVKIITQVNRGLSCARNAGLDAATGDFVQLLDCDDMLTPGKIDEQIGHFRLVEALDVSVIGCAYTNNELDSFEYYPGLLSVWSFGVEDFANHWERGFSIPIHCALFHRRIFDAFRFFDGQRAKEDWHFWTRIATEGARIAHMGSVGAVYRIHESSICRSMAEVGREWLQAAIEIDRMVRGEIPNFLDQAVSWYSSHYAGKSGPDATGDAQSSGMIAAREWASAKDEAKVVIPAIPPLKGDPRVSIVMPVYNHYEHLWNALVTALRQLDGTVELVLVDDRSSDARVGAMLRSVSHLPGVTVIFNTDNLGIARTLNKGVEAARGTYIAFMDCDDELLDDSLRVAMRYIDVNGACDYLFTDRYDIDDKGNILRLVRYGGYEGGYFTGDIGSDLINGMVASHLKIISRRAILAAGGHDPAWSGVQDWDLALKIAKFGRFLYLAEPLYCYRVHGNSVTNSDRRAQFLRTNQVRRNFAPTLLRGGADVADEAVTLKLEQQTPAELAALYSRNNLVLDARTGLTPRDLWFVREFNSYFDRIIVGNKELFVALLGYVWDHRALVYEAATDVDVPRREKLLASM